MSEHQHRPPRRRAAAVDVDPDAIRQARLDAGLSLAQVAGREMTRQAVHLIESGKTRPRRRTLQIIARRLGVPMSSLLAKPAPPGVTAVVAGERITIRRDGVDVLGIDLETGVVGTWLDGETWVRLALLPRTLPCDSRTPTERRVGTPHEETNIDGRAHCATCGWVEEADPDDPTVRGFHGDSLENDDDEPEELVLCFFCRQPRPLRTSHRFQGAYVGEDCCWDERLRSAE